MTKDATAFLRVIAGVIRDYVAVKTDAITARLAALEERTALVPRDGLNGRDGDRGPQGDRGEIGPMGPQGEKGADGSIGSLGERGDKGDQGIQGLPGVDGASISVGSGPPQVESKHGDVYIDMTTGDIYQCR